MYRIQVRHQYSKIRVFYGEPVASLNDAHPLLANLEEEWKDWQARGFPPISDDKAFKHLEGSEIYIIGDDGNTYWLDENGGFQIMN